MRGWHRESMRHALAARGIKSNPVGPSMKNIKISKYITRKSIQISFKKNDVIIASVIAEPLDENDPDLWVDLVVEPGYRGKGYAKLMLKELIKIAEEYKIDLVGAVNPVESGTSAKRLFELYKEAGFTVYPDSDFISYRGGLR